MKLDKHIDAYIEKTQPFAKPILMHLRKLIHLACPEVEETIKWGMPAFYFKGPLCSFAAFKNHAVFDFWKAKLLSEQGLNLQKSAAHGGPAMGHFGKLTKLEDLPPDHNIMEILSQAILLNLEGKKIERVRKNPEPVVTPQDLLSALEKNERANETYHRFSESNKREYVDWINDAKSAVTRQRRIVSALEWMAEGKIRNWKYVKLK